LLRKYEDDARIAVERDFRHHEEDPENQKNKIKYFKSKEKFAYISKITGKDSPAKKVALERANKAKLT